jgi:hypothetical protein
VVVDGAVVGRVDARRTLCLNLENNGINSEFFKFSAVSAGPGVDLQCNFRGVAQIDCFAEQWNLFGGTAEFCRGNNRFKQRNKGLIYSRIWGAQSRVCGAKKQTAVRGSREARSDRVR